MRTMNNYCPDSYAFYLTMPKKDSFKNSLFLLLDNKVLILHYLAY